MLLTPRADWRVICPGWKKCAGDLMTVADKYIKSDMTVWDIGANQGIFSAIASNRVGDGGWVFAVEPDPYYASLISRNALRLKGNYAQIQVLCTAVMDTVRIVDFGVAARGHARSSMKEFSRESPKYIRPVTTVTLDVLLSYWPMPAFVKIDVEGAESAVLRGAERLLNEVRPYFYIEVRDNNARDVGEVFHSARYDLFHLEGMAETPSDLPSMYTIARPR